ncbi:glycoside hydrolase family 3 protein [Puniceicoccus vermicola]|uniref:Glycoside hydrolase family 3 protein n=1 Tax=Puniceicoccus vermicola TaxID=388746 RepID=A0A7X1AZ48_9BACT|nr:glycoside hydrolase family 3 protein [Puniceicoccus vermicola]MBC2602582.1 glycoside hydrolase family 3 protein [Puniceicoccus vermicola]
MKPTPDIQSLLEKMSVQDKVGQCFVIGFTGSVMTPAILERIATIRPAGIRMGMNFRIKSAYYDPYAVGEKFAHRALRAPTGTVKDFLPGLPPPYVTGEEYAHFLNRLKEAALKNPAAIPLHITYDMEGDISADFPRSPLRFFPSSRGLSQSGDPELAERVAWAVGAQMSGLGCNWIHWPVLDVNTDPLNPEIGTRSFGDSAEIVEKYGKKVFEGLKRSKTIATAKHFPGRGHSIGDAHHGLPLVELDREGMEEHLKPFRSLIEAGVPSIMTAHTVYPALDPSGDPASLSKTIITDFLKGEMGFEGVVTSDDITMGAILEKYEVHEAVIKAIDAGSDLILLRDESTLVDEVYAKVVEAVEEGKISEERLNDAAGRVLKIKAEYGLFEEGALVDPAEAEAPARSSEVISIASEAAQRATRVLRDRKGILPLDPGTRVLLVEQANPLHINVNSQECHPGILWEAMMEHGSSVAMVEVKMSYEEADHQRIANRMEEADVVVLTNTYYRRGANGHEFVQEFCRNCEKPVVVVTNTDLPLSLDDSFDSVVLSYGSSSECVKEVARHLYGKAER